MALTIKPGYDFGVNEVPTRDTLLRQARKLQITGIGLSLIDATLIAQSIQSASSPSLPSEGWLWSDGAGNLWVETTNGQCRAHRAQGGWETRRYSWSGAATKPGDPGQISGGANGETLAFASGNDVVAAMNNGAIYNAYPEDSAVSGGFTRMCGRGFLDMDAAGTTDIVRQQVSLMRTLTSGNTWQFPHPNYKTVVPTKKTYAATVIGDTYGRSMGWVYGCNLYGDGANL